MFYCTHEKAYKGMENLASQEENIFSNPCPFKFLARSSLNYGTIFLRPDGYLLFVQYHFAFYLVQIFN